MSYASDVRGELARLPMADECCARSEMTLALMCCSGIGWRGRDRYALTITAADAATGRRDFGMLKQFWGVTGQIRTLAGNALNGQMRYQLAIQAEDTPRLLEKPMLRDADGLFGLRSSPAPELMRFACCRKSALRAAFMICGAINNPEKAYHFEIAAPTEALTTFLMEQLAYFDIPARTSHRRSRPVIYLKHAEDISDVLSLLGAAKAMMDLENIRVKKEVGNRVNRQLNCDNSNINRVMFAAESQTKDILYIHEELGLDKLPKPLREMAELRVVNPETPLADLGDMLDPPISKSGVSARLRKLTEIAGKLRSGEEIDFSPPKRGRKRAEKPGEGSEAE